MILGGIRSLFAAFAVMLATVASVQAAELPEHEWKMIREIAKNNDLTRDQTLLLAAIRKLENGRPGLEFGIGGPMNNGHPSHRYRDGVKSFYIQGAWAAGTIRKRYDGDLFAFASRYCPRDPNGWERKIRNIMKRLKAEQKK